MPKGIYPHPVKRHKVIQPSDPSYRLIALSQNQNAMVDTDNFAWLSKWHWQAWWCTATKSFYAIRTQKLESGKRVRVAMHREILGSKEGDKGDHKNHDTLDNRRKNLRSCTHSQNCCNRRLRSDNTSGYRGVSRRRYNGKWKSCITVNGRMTMLGQFIDPKKAAIAYNEAAKRYHGEFASLNLI
jgi:hypothetical protein